MVPTRSALDYHFVLIKICLTQRLLSGVLSALGASVVRVIGRVAGPLMQRIYRAIQAMSVAMVQFISFLVLSL